MKAKVKSKILSKPAIVTLHKACNVTGDGSGKETSVIGYYTTFIMAKSACANNPHTNIKEVYALKVNSENTKDESDEEAPLTPAEDSVVEEYYILVSTNPVQVNVNFEEFSKQLRANALAKLTDEEKIALGINK